MQPITYTFEELLAHKEKAPREAVEALKIKADKILAEPTLKITDVEITRPSGDPHDYISMGPYWWPNPDTPDGLPYVRRDGYVNPEARKGIGPGALYGRVRTLALAEFYIGGKVYAEYANRQLYDWFLNPETKMNPNGKFAQGIPGICEGRGTGLISFGTVYLLFNGMAILDNLGLLDEKINEGVKAWYVEFANWILTHEYGLAMDNGRDNHASWHDANLLATAMYTNRPQLAKSIYTTAYERRVRFLIKEDGSQPSELRRTKAIGYSFFNLHAQLVIANIAERLGCTDYWSVDERRGKCILKSAVDFIYPYVCDPSTFPYQELYPDKYDNDMARSLLAVAKRFPDEDYAERAERFNKKSEEFNLEPSL